MLPEGFVERFSHKFEQSTYYGTKLSEMSKDELMAALLCEVGRHAEFVIEKQRQSAFLSGLRGLRGEKG